MKECGVPEGTVIGEACRRISGTEESCYLLSQVKDESGETVEYLRPLIKRTSGCPFRQKALERIEEKAQQPREARGSFLNTDGILAMPQTMKKLAVELGRLNDNLEGLAPTLNRIPEFLEMADRLTEVMEDIRAIAAPLSGFKVVEKK